MPKRKPVLATVAAGLLVVLGAALAIAGAWPFTASSGDPAEGRHVVWQGDVTLLEGGLYALDLLPAVALSSCARCLVITSKTVGHTLLSAGNGIQGWTGRGAPSFVDCVLLRNKGTYDSIALGGTHTTLEEVAQHGWICATGGSDDGLMRMRFNGHEGGRYKFSVTSWGRPAEG
jgi:hypothetical protein